MLYSMVGIRLKSRVGEKGQIVIPKPIREQLHISPATELLFDVEDDKVIMAKRSDREVISELLTRWKKKTLPPQKIDWDKLIYSQYEA